MIRIVALALVLAGCRSDPPARFGKCEVTWWSGDHPSHERCWYLDQAYTCERSWNRTWDCALYSTPARPAERS